MLYRKFGRRTAYFNSSLALFFFKGKDTIYKMAYKD